MRRLVWTAVAGALLACGCGGTQDASHSTPPAPERSAAPPAPVEKQTTGTDEPSVPETAATSPAAPSAVEPQIAAPETETARPAQADAPAAMPEVDLGQSHYAQSTLLGVGDTIPQLHLKDLHGKASTVAPPSGKGELLVLVFWDSTNLFATLQLRHLQRDVAGKLQGVHVVAVNRGESADVVAPIVEKEKLSFPVVLDTDASVFAQFATETVPRTYLVGNGGEILWLAVTFQGRTTMNTLRQAIDAARAD